MNENIETLIKYLDLAETLGVEEVKLTGCDVRVLNDHLRTIYKQKEELIKLIKWQAKEVVNMTKELESLNLWMKIK